MLVYVLFAMGFVILLKGADILVAGSSSIAKKFSISPLVIGLTIVAFGTSAPEFIVNIFAALGGNTDIAIGNILGSNIANILLILGVSAIIYPIAAKSSTVLKEIPFSLLAALAVGVIANDIFFDGSIASVITRSDGLILLGFFVIFLYYTFGIAFNKESNVDEGEEVKEFSTSRSIVYIVVGLVCLTFGGKWIVDGAVLIASAFGVSQTLIAVSIVAVGTSLPEFATSAVAAFKKQTDIAIGNIVGSNIFNIFFVLGVSAIIRPLPFKPAQNIDIIVTIFASLLLFILMYVGKRHVIQRSQGVLMVIFYIAYITFLVANQ